MIALADRHATQAGSVGRRQPASAHGPSPCDLARRWAAIGHIVAELPPTAHRPRRLARINVSIGRLPYATAPWAARFWEPQAPPGAQRVEWLLTSRRCLTCLEDALELLESTPGLVAEYAVA
ncbi:MAG: hypothetical protein RMN53_08060 [Anaerolineae bacterium]|nr:hypothetical protein [Anaerolineae bacterium]